MLEPLLCTKELATIMGLSPETVRVWCRRLNITPTVPGHASQRWTKADAETFIAKWRSHWQRKQQRKHKP